MSFSQLTPEIFSKVDQAIAELDYSPDSAARRLAMHRHNRQHSL